jgi:hypothetical protein
MLRKVPLDNVMKLARDPLIRLVMQSDGLCEDDIVSAFATAMNAVPANDTAAAMPGGELALTVVAQRRPGPVRPMRQGHMRIV